MLCENSEDGAAVCTAVVQRYYKSSQRTLVYLYGRRRPAWLPDAERIGSLKTPLRRGTQIRVCLKADSGVVETVSEVDYVERVLNDLLERVEQGHLRPLACADVLKLVSGDDEDDEALRVSIDGQMPFWPDLPGDVQYVVPKRLMPGSDIEKLICLSRTLRDGFARVALHGLNRVDGALVVELTMDF